MRSNRVIQLHSIIHLYKQDGCQSNEMHYLLRLDNVKTVDNPLLTVVSYLFFMH